MSDSPRRPTAEQLKRARGKTVPDIIAPNLKVLFCGINPGLYSAAVGHHFARPGNRFWPTLHAAGFTPKILSPFDEKELLKLGCGITNLVGRATASADELEPWEYLKGTKSLERKIKRHRPRFVAILGLGAYRLAFASGNAPIGLQDRAIADSRLWVLPNPSGLNAHYQRDDLAEVFKKLRRASD